MSKIKNALMCGVCAAVLAMIPTAGFANMYGQYGQPSDQSMNPGTYGQPNSGAYGQTNTMPHSGNAMPMSPGDGQPMISHPTYMNQPPMNDPSAPANPAAPNVEKSYFRWGIGGYGYPYGGYYNYYYPYRPYYYSRPYYPNNYYYYW